MIKGTKYLLFFLLLVIPQLLIAQEREAGDYDYEKEVFFGVNKNTNGGLIGGLYLKLGSKITESTFQFFSLELANVKNPKERRYTNSFGNSFIYGKSNYLYSIRPQYGRELVLFKKAPQKGVQVSVLSAIGPSFGIIAPYYVDYFISGQETTRAQYDPEIVQSIGQIIGPGRLFEGLGQSEFAVGANVKAALSFEFGVFKSNVTGLELGYELEGFTKEIVLMPTVENRQIFQSVYFTLFYGFRK